MEFFENNFQESIWEDNYRSNGEQIEGTQNRLVGAIYKDETEELKKALYDALMSKRLFFGGRTTANTGTGMKNVFAFNCYAAQRAIKDCDSITGIYTDLLNAANILKTEGGIGFNFNHLRPRGTLIKGIGIGTPGVIAFMELYDKSAEIITKGHSGELMQAGTNGEVKKKIRKGAQMGMLSCFSENTEVLTTAGWINIKQLVYDMLENKVAYKAIDDQYNNHNIINPFVTEPEQLYLIELEDGTTLEVTEDHKFEVKNINTGEIYLKALKDIDSENELFTVLK